MEELLAKGRLHDFGNSANIVPLPAKVSGYLNSFLVAIEFPTGEEAKKFIDWMIEHERPATEELVEASVTGN